MIWDFENLLSRRLMLWAVLSIIVGAALLAFGAGNGPAVGLQGLLWGAIDALIAFFGLRKASPHLGQPSSRVAEIQEASRLRKVLWMRAGRDLFHPRTRSFLGRDRLGNSDPGGLFVLL